jgi:plasmid stabilization system protein ParE
MRLRFTPRAVQDLKDLAGYIRLHDAGAAERVRASIYETLRNIILFPKMGRRQTTEGVRKVVTRRYPYFIYYRVDDSVDEIVVLGVKHPARERDHSDV